MAKLIILMTIKYELWIQPGLNVLFCFVSFTYQLQKFAQSQCIFIKMILSASFYFLKVGKNAFKLNPNTLRMLYMRCRCWESDWTRLTFKFAPSLSLLLTKNSNRSGPNINSRKRMWRCRSQGWVKYYDLS